MVSFSTSNEMLGDWTTETEDRSESHRRSPVREAPSRDHFHTARRHRRGGGSRVAGKNVRRRLTKPMEN